MSEKYKMPSEQVGENKSPLCANGTNMTNDGQHYYTYFYAYFEAKTRVFKHTKVEENKSAYQPRFKGFLSLIDVALFRRPIGKKRKLKFFVSILTGIIV